MAQRRIIYFEGRVQGVGFRATAVYLARDLALAGTVENAADGRVRLAVEGEAQEIDRLVERLREQFGAFVRKVVQEMLPAAPETGRGGQIAGGGIRIVHEGFGG